MPPRLAKQAVTCPKCGASQQESSGVISTFCRSCSQHFEVSARPEPPRPAAAGPGWGEKLQPLTQRLEPLGQRLLILFEPWLLRYATEIEGLRKLYERWRPPQFRRVRCHECGRIHEAPFVAGSTSCPGCNSHIELGDVTIDKRVRRVVRTRGELIIKKFGYLNSDLTICGAADIGGGAAGKVFCDGETKIRTSGRLNCEIGSRRLRVEKGADVMVAHPIRVHDMVVRGKITARIYCNGTLRVLKRGFLRGQVHARSITVDKGGLLAAELNIGHFDPDILGTLQERSCYMAIEDSPTDLSQARLPI